MYVHPESVRLCARVRMFGRTGVWGHVCASVCVCEYVCACTHVNHTSTIYRNRANAFVFLYGATIASDNLTPLIDWLVRLTFVTP